MALSVAQAKSRLGVAVRSNNPTAEQIARRDLAAAKLEAYVAKVVAEAPPLTEQQRRAIRALLKPALDGGDAA